jgi:hypothetical protein
VNEFSAFEGCPSLSSPFALAVVFYYGACRMGSAVVEPLRLEVCFSSSADEPSVCLGKLFTLQKCLSVDSFESFGDEISFSRKFIGV